MDEFIVNKSKIKAKTREELLQLTKEELVNEILRLEAHNTQLKNIIRKGFKINDVADKSHNKQKKFDFSKQPKRRILLQICYFGWSFNGLATQEDSNNTIEHHLFEALIRSCLIESRDTCSYHRCGRTDKGVSSFGQVISLTVRSKLSEDNENLSEELDYCKMINRILPEEIRAIRWWAIDNKDTEFSARFDCKRRTYRYYFPKGDLCIASMRSACERLAGSHDFRNLCKMDVANGVTSFIRHVIKAEIKAIAGNDTDDAYSMYYLQIEGNAFLWHQIRCIFGLLMLVGQKNEKPEIIDELLDVETNPRKPQYSIALDTPLNLFKCDYEIGDRRWFYDVEELKVIIRNYQKLWTLHSIKATMIRDVLDSLEEALKDQNCAPILSQTDCLLEGVRPKVYRPLLKRELCSSLEERIQHFEKKRRIVKKKES